MWVTSILVFHKDIYSLCKCLFFCILSLVPVVFVTFVTQRSVQRLHAFTCAHLWWLNLAFCCQSASFTCEETECTRVRTDCSKLLCKSTAEQEEAYTTTSCKQRLLPQRLAFMLLWWQFYQNWMVFSHSNTIIKTVNAFHRHLHKLSVNFTLKVWLSASV